MSKTAKPWYPGEGVATKDANGRDLGYAGPDGSTLYYLGYPVQSVAAWEAREDAPPSTHRGSTDTNDAGSPTVSRETVGLT